MHVHLRIWKYSLAFKLRCSHTALLSAAVLWHACSWTNRLSESLWVLGYLCCGRFWSVEGRLLSLYNILSSMVVTFSRSLWYGCLLVVAEDLENQIEREKNLFALAIKLSSVEYKQCAEDSRGKEGCCQQVHTFLHSDWVIIWSKVVQSKMSNVSFSSNQLYAFWKMFQT